MVVCPAALTEVMGHTFLLLAGFKPLPKPSSRAANGRTEIIAFISEFFYRRSAEYSRTSYELKSLITAQM